MADMLKWYEQSYALDEDKLNDFVEDILRRTGWKLFENQQDVVEMANETKEGIPRFKEGAIDVIQDHLYSELSWLVSYMTDRIVVAYLKGNILPSNEIRWRFNEDMSDEEASQFWDDIDEYIWNDYAKNLGKEKTAELFEKWGKNARF